MCSLHNATIDFSAQFGGQDAAGLALPHFKSLKAAAIGVTVDRFPCPQLAFILRVDGEVSRYSLSGAGYPDADRSGKYFSVDIGITESDRECLIRRIETAIMEAIPLIETFVRSKGGQDFDVKVLEASLEVLCGRYREAVDNHSR